MAIADRIGQFRDYYSRHGLLAAIRRAALQVKRALFSSRMVVFYCDLHSPSLPAPRCVPSSMKIERVRSYADLTAEDVLRMTGFWNPKEAIRRIHQRFGKEATLWVIRSAADGSLAGFGWSLQGGTVEPYYFLLAATDVHLFDFHVYEEYRGQGLNPLLVGHILSTVARETGGRAFIECAEWNQPQLASLKKTPFHRLGLVSTTTLFRRVFSSWSDSHEDKDAQKGRS
jgi:GNAT superfamily N-acetyltransferase